MYIIDFPGSQTFRVRQNHTTGSPGSLVSNHRTSQPPELQNWFISHNRSSVYILLVLFLWRTATNTTTLLKLIRCWICTSTRSCLPKKINSFSFQHFRRWISSYRLLWPLHFCHIIHATLQPYKKWTLTPHQQNASQVITTLSTKSRAPGMGNNVGTIIATIFSLFSLGPSAKASKQTNKNLLTLKEKSTMLI